MIRRYFKDGILGVLIFVCMLGGGCDEAQRPLVDGLGPIDLIDRGSDGQAVRNASLALVSECMKRADSNKTVRIDGYLAELCRKPNYYYGGPVHFTVSRQNDRLLIQYKIRFQIYPDSTSSERSLELLQKARACLPQVQSVWQRYGVVLDIPMDSNKNPDGASGAAQQNVMLVDWDGRSNSGMFYVSGDQDSLCRVMVHEVGHHLGLEDEYFDSNCPDRPLVSAESNPYSIMAAIWGMGWDNFEFYSRHVQRVFSGFCGDASVSEYTADKIILGYPE